uniref:C-type lectin domain-containing protein n=1 Tax=Periophthalmus magnuspinnatus TaxID=409849 RepID=A0A3B4B9X0_9GOBI
MCLILDYAISYMHPSPGLSLPCSLSRRYFYQTQLLTWDEARQNCQKQYADLATFETQEDIDSLQDRPTGMAGQAWIGLRNDPSSWQHMGNASTSWRWSETGETSQSGFSSWLFLEPNSLPGEYCVQIDSSGFWNDASCDLMMPSVCKLKKKKHAYKTWEHLHI